MKEHFYESCGHPTCQTDSRQIKFRHVQGIALGQDVHICQPASSFISAENLNDLGLPLAGANLLSVIPTYTD